MPHLGFRLGPDGTRCRDRPGRKNLSTRFALLAKELPQTRLAVVGDGPLREKVEAQVEALGLGERVHFLGGREARTFLPALDALLLTSAYEGIPYVVLEALALGVPVVSAPTPGLGPWLRAEGLALVAEDGSPEALAEALKAVLREPSLAGRLAERGYAWTGKWGLEGMVERTFDLYRLLQASHKPPV